MANLQGKLVQKEAEIAMGGNFGEAVKLGFLMRGTIDRATSEIQDVERIREMIESGEHLAIVAEARAATRSVRVALDGLQPNQAFIQLCGMSEDTYYRRLKEIKELGAETTRNMRVVGLPYKSIRLLAESPKELRDEAKRLAATDAVTREMFEAVIDKAAELAESKARAEEKAKAQERRAVEAETKAAKRAEQLADEKIRTKGLNAEIVQLKAGAKIQNRSDVDRAIELMLKLGNQMLNVAGGVDLSMATPQTLGQFGAWCLQTSGALIDQERQVSAMLEEM